MHNQSFPIFARLHGTERTLLLFSGGRFVLTLDVDHPVRSPQPFKSVGSAGMSSRILSHSTAHLSDLTARRDVAGDLVDGRINGHAILLPTVAVAERDGVSSSVLPAGDQDVWHLGSFGIADFLLHPVV